MRQGLRISVHNVHPQRAMHVHVDQAGGQQAALQVYPSGVGRGRGGFLPNLLDDAIFDQ